MFVQWNPKCRSCDAYVDARQQNTSVHSPPEIKELHFLHSQTPQQPETTDIQRYLSKEEQLDAISFTCRQISTRICIQCTSEISLRIQNKKKEQDELIALLNKAKAPILPKLTEAEKQQIEQEHETALREYERAKNVLHELQQCLLRLKKSCTRARKKKCGNSYSD